MLHDTWYQVYDIYIWYNMVYGICYVLHAIIIPGMLYAIYMLYVCDTIPGMIYLAC